MTENNSSAHIGVRDANIHGGYNSTEIPYMAGDAIATSKNVHLTERFSNNRSANTNITSACSTPSATLMDRRVGRKLKNQDSSGKPFGKKTE